MQKRSIFITESTLAYKPADFVQKIDFSAEINTAHLISRILKLYTFTTEQIHSCPKQEIRM